MTIPEFFKAAKNYSQDVQKKHIRNARKQVELDKGNDDNKIIKNSEEMYAGSKDPYTQQYLLKIAKEGVRCGVGQVRISSSLDKAEDLNLSSQVVSSFSHDFEDGAGAVSAHRHRNIDGSNGGWVADSATVDADVYIGEDAQVSGKAQVLKGSKIKDKSRVSGDAVVSETCMYDNSQVVDKAVVTRSTLRGNAKVLDDVKVAASIVCGNSSIGKTFLIGTGELINERVFNGRELGKEKQKELDAALVGATRQDNIEDMEWCLQHGADVNAKNNDGWTPLHWGAGWSSVGAIRVLVKLGGDINAKAYDGCTPLSFAKSFNTNEAIKLLEKLGAK